MAGRWIPRGQAGGKAKECIRASCIFLRTRDCVWKATARNSWKWVQVVEWKRAEVAGGARDRKRAGEAAPFGSGCDGRTKENVTLKLCDAEVSQGAQ